VNYLVMFTLLRYRFHAAAHILTHSVHLAVGPQSGFKHKYQVWDCNFRFRLQIKGSLQLWVAGRLHFDKGLEFFLCQSLT